MSQRIIAALLITLSSTAVLAQTQTQTQTVEPRAVPTLVENAPDRHVVVPGDTLWGISAKFLKDPSRWAEVWKLNPTEVKNPHRIYPGQVIVLNRGSSDGAPQLSLLEEKLQPRIREEGQEQAIPAIPQKSIEPFLTRPLVLDEGALEATPRIVAVQDGRVMAGMGDQVYASGLGKESGGGLDYDIYRPGRALLDPDTKEELGREAVIVGSARLLAYGDPATLRIVGTQTEINKGDRLVARAKPKIISYPQHRPEKPIDAKVVFIAGDAPSGARYQTMAISKGAKDGVEVGHVLALYRPGLRVTDRYKGEVKDITTPEERFGLIYVFRVYDRVSYGIIMQADRQVTRGDQIRNP